MSYMSARPAGDAATASIMVLDAARCWRAARDSGASVQPRLTVVLRDHACEILAPCFDSVMAICESALGRQLRVGEGESTSEDEHLLLGLIDGSKRRRACLECRDSIASALDCALCSLRIMMGMALASSGRTH
ncbi:MAG: hypothetical protein V4472_02290 [Pseudomonadota bacterium]